MRMRSGTNLAGVNSLNQKYDQFRPRLDKIIKTKHNLCQVTLQISVTDSAKRDIF